MERCIDCSFMQLSQPQSLIPIISIISNRYTICIAALHICYLHYTSLKKLKFIKNYFMVSHNLR